MINSDAHLIDNLFSEEIEMLPTRDGYGDGLVEAAREDNRIVALAADLTESTRTNKFAEEFPERFVQIGVAEQNLVTVASGMAAAGKIPFAASYAAFSPGRNWEQIRTTICYNDRPVKVIGAHAGISVGPDGATHQMLEDIAIMRALPNMVVLVPADSVEAKKAVLAAAKTNNPTYIRLGRDKSPVFTTLETPFEIGKAQVLRYGEGLTIVATGIVVYEALKAAEQLNAEVINVSTIKPLDTDTILESVRKTNKVITIEEHQITGGLGGAIAELLVENHPVPLRRIGINDRFGESGEPSELMKHFNLTSDHLIEVAHSF